MTTLKQTSASSPQLILQLAGNVTTPHSTSTFHFPIIFLLSKCVHAAEAGVSIHHSTHVADTANMKSMQRKFGGLMKRTEDQQDVGSVLAEFRAADEKLERVCDAKNCQLSDHSI